MLLNLRDFFFIRAELSTEIVDKCVFEKGAVMEKKKRFQRVVQGLVDSVKALLRPVWNGLVQANKFLALNVSGRLGVLYGAVAAAMFGAILSFGSHYLDSVVGMMAFAVMVFAVFGLAGVASAILNNDSITVSLVKQYIFLLGGALLLSILSLYLHMGKFEAVDLYQVETLLSYAAVMVAYHLELYMSYLLMDKK